eukprot:1196264-Prorocentrum_minimum.AAC.6
MSGGKPSPCLRAELRLPESVGPLVGEPKRFLTRLPRGTRTETQPAVCAFASQTPEKSRKAWGCRN